MSEVSLNDRYDVVIVGGGVIGLATAWRLARSGRSVALFERERFGSGASHAAAGMLAPISEVRMTELGLYALGVQSAECYQQFAAELEEDSGSPSGYHRPGTLLLARDRDEAEALERERVIRESLGLELEQLLPSEVTELEPAIAPGIRAGLKVESDHCVDPDALIQALVLAARALGATLIEGASVKEVLMKGGRCEGLRVEGRGDILAEAVVVAAGCESGIVGGVENPVPVRPVKGQILRLCDPAGPGLFEHVLRGEECYMIPRKDGRYAVGASVEEQGFDRSITAGAAHDLLRAAVELVPGVREFELEGIDVGLRPATPDNEPIIGPGPAAGLIWATGHFRGGILLAPITAELVVAGIERGGWSHIDSRFAPGRFAVSR